MKLVSTIARYLLGAIFLVMGLNSFFHFIPLPPPSGLAAQFTGALHDSHYMVVIFLLQLILAIFLLIGRYVSLSLTLLAPIIVNIVCFHVFMSPEGLPLAIVVAVLWLLSYWRVRSSFAGLFQARPTAGA